MQILLIEPDNELASIYKQAFNRLGHKLVHVTGAQQAIVAADGIQPDIVIMELQLAAHSGPAFMYEFRSYPDWAGIPIIVNTLIPLDRLVVYKKALNELGVKEWLYKPQTSLAKLIDVALSKIV